MRYNIRHEENNGIGYTKKGFHTYVMQRKCRSERLFLQHAFDADLGSFALAVGCGCQDLPYDALAILVGKEAVVVVSAKESE